MSITVWRIGVETKDYTADDLAGIGAARTGGRWNSAGTNMIYCSENISLATLETLSHLRAATLPYNRFLVRITIPDDVWSRAEVVVSPLGGWDALPHGRAGMTFGDAWVKQARSCLLCVPSVIVPDERNILINPAHPDAGSIQATTLRRIQYDPRFF